MRYLKGGFIKLGTYVHTSFFTKIIFMEKTIKIIITTNCIDRYNQLYFKQHPRAKKAPIRSPQHPSINTYMTMNNMARNNLKQRWKDFIVWKINDMGLSQRQVKKCEILYRTFFYQNRRHDLDNLSPKFIFDGFVEAGLIPDDDSEHITSLTIECGVDKENPRIEFWITILEE